MITVKRARLVAADTNSLRCDACGYTTTATGRHSWETTNVRYACPMCEEVAMRFIDAPAPCVCGHDPGAHQPQYTPGPSGPRMDVCTRCACARYQGAPPEPAVNGYVTTDAPRQADAGARERQRHVKCTTPECGHSFLTHSERGCHVTGCRCRRYQTPPLCALCRDRHAMGTACRGRP